MQIAGLNQNQTQAYGNSLNGQSIQQQSYVEKTGSISITTDEGDIVTFNQSSFAALDLSSESFSSPLAQGTTFTATSISMESMSFSVEGDLNEQELADIADLYDSLTTIADDFFNGDYGKAMVGAMSIGDLGSLSSLEASFSHTQVSATQITNYHAMPADSDKLLDAFRDLDLGDGKEWQKEQDLLSARWQQITDFLDQQNQKAQEEMQTENRQGNQAEAMMREISTFTEQHPRLSPYAVPLADRAIQESAQDSDTAPLQQMNQKQFLKNDFLKNYQSWLEA